MGELVTGCWRVRWSWATCLHFRPAFCTWSLAPRMGGVGRGESLFGGGDGGSGGLWDEEGDAGVVGLLLFVPV